MRDPRNYIVRFFAACGIVVATTTVMGTLLFGPMNLAGRWHADYPGMALPTASILILYGIGLFMLSNGRK